MIIKFILYNIFFTIIFLLSYYIIQKSIKNNKVKFQISWNIVSFIFGFTVIYLTKNFKFNNSFSEMNSIKSYEILYFCLIYFMWDLLLSTLIRLNEINLTLHHLFTIIFILYILFKNKYGDLICYILFYFEWTNPPVMVYKSLKMLNIYPKISWISNYVYIIVFLYTRSFFIFDLEKKIEKPTLFFLIFLDLIWVISLHWIILIFYTLSKHISIFFKNKLINKIYLNWKSIKNTPIYNIFLNLFMFLFCFKNIYDGKFENLF